MRLSVRCPSSLIHLFGSASFLILALAACGHSAKKGPVEKAEAPPTDFTIPKADPNALSEAQEASVEVLYEHAFKFLKQRRFQEAAGAFDAVEREHPYSIWARRSMLMSAYAHYQSNEYDEAISAADRFIELHPGNKDAPYAYYLKAMCNYEQVQDVARDQQKTIDAMNALQDVLRRFPETEYARDSQLKLDLTRDQLAGREMSVGRYYEHRHEYVAAIGRFRTVIEIYQTTSHVPEALHRLVESYYALRLDGEAQAAAAVLGYNYPGSDWYKDSYRLLTSHGLKPKEQPDSWLTKTIKR